MSIYYLMFQFDSPIEKTGAKLRGRAEALVPGGLSFETTFEGTSTCSSVRG